MNSYFQKTEDILSPEQFLSLSENEKVNIAASEIIPPTLGENNFGKIKVNYIIPILKRAK